MASTALSPAHQTEPQVALVDSLRTSMEPGKVVVVHNGARDGYQVALALSQAGLLQCLVTDFFWSEQTLLGGWLARRLPSVILSVLRKRGVPGLPKSQVKTCFSAGIGGFLLDKARAVPFGTRRWFTRKADARLGRVAGRIARRSGSQVLSYSYYGFEAFRAAGRPGMLFQMHPHPLTMRSLLLEELDANPDCAESLEQEWELNLPEDDFRRLVEETMMPIRSLAASSFTRSSLIDNGVNGDSVQVVPYGVDLQKFHPDLSHKRSIDGPLKLLFVGRINQRKGIKYLLQALSLLPNANIELTVCGRMLDRLELFESEATRIYLRPSVSAVDLVKAYQQADLFVLPSIAEGFGQVLLEALACGLPILSTTHTAAPDLIEDGVEGFIVEPRRPDELADRIAWALEHRGELVEMRVAARECAERFPWSRFHAEVVHNVHAFVDSPSKVNEELA